MNKNRMILAVIGGVIGLAVLALAYLNWSAYSAKTAAMEGDEETEGLEAVLNKAQTLSRKPVYPCVASVNEINANATAVADWQTEAMKLAVRGDKVFPKTTPAAFKTFIVEDAKRLSSLPGFANGVIAKPDFTFGPFKDYIAEGKMPAEAQLAELQRKWDDVATVVETLSKCGAAELVNLEFKTVEKAAEEEAKPARQKKQSARKGAKTVESAIKEPVAYTYVFGFTTRPAGLVKLVNALETSERFIVVDSFTFSRPVDVIASALGAEDKAEAKASTGRRRRGRGRAAAAEPKPEEADKSAKNSGIVTDPVLDAPLAVTMTVTVYDFRSLEDDEKKSEEEAK